MEIEEELVFVWDQKKRCKTILLYRGLFKPDNNTTYVLIALKLHLVYAVITTIFKDPIQNTCMVLFNNARHFESQRLLQLWQSSLKWKQNLASSMMCCDLGLQVKELWAYTKVWGKNNSTRQSVLWLEFLYRIPDRIMNEVVQVKSRLQGRTHVVVTQESCRHQGKLGLKGAICAAVGRVVEEGLTLSPHGDLESSWWWLWTYKGFLTSFYLV